MENFIVRVIIETQNGELIKEGIFETKNIAEIKAFGGTSIIDDFINETLTEIREDRKNNPHHHQNRLD